MPSQRDVMPSQHDITHDFPTWRHVTSFVIKAHSYKDVKMCRGKKKNEQQENICVTQVLTIRVSLMTVLYWDHHLLRKKLPSSYRSLLFSDHVSKSDNLTFPVMLIPEQHTKNWGPLVRQELVNLIDLWWMYDELNARGSQIRDRQNDYPYSSWTPQCDEVHDDPWWPPIFCVR